MNLRVAVAAACVSCAFAGSAFAGQGWYVSVGAGWNKPNDIDFPGVGPVVPPLPPLLENGGHITTSGNFIGTGALGYKWYDWRVEIEGSGSHNNVDSPFAGGIGWTGVSANFLYDIPLSMFFGGEPRWMVYLGGGVGAGAVNRHLVGQFVELGDFDSWHFQWQVIAGFSYAFQHNLDIYAEYRYRGIQDNTTNIISPISAGITAQDPRANAVLVGVRWYPWYVVAPPPPPPLPPPPPPPPPPPAVKTFVVFFDFNKSNLTPEAEQVVAQAVQEVKRENAVRILVTGHTDTVGSDRYNQALSVRRATTVKDDMVRQGVEGSAISIEGKSFHDPLVPTGPNVREPQNRRAVIDLGGGSS